MNGLKIGKVFLFLILFHTLFFTISQGFEQQTHNLILEGYVHEKDGTVISNATMILFRYDPFNDHIILYDVAHSDSYGFYYFNTNVSSESVLELMAYCDRDWTPGFDWLPHLETLDTKNVTLDYSNFTLRPAATLYFKGPLRLVDKMQEIKPTYRLVEPYTYEEISYSNFSLVYGDNIIHRELLKLNGSTIITPALSPFLIDCIFYNISNSEGGPFILDQGASLKLDNREYTLPQDMVLLETLSNNIWSVIRNAESYMFYTTSEVQLHQKALENMHSANEAFNNGDYEEAYISLRNAYLLLVSAKTSIESLFYDAYASTGIIILLLAVSSFSVTPFFVEGKIKRIGLSSAIYVFLLGYIYVVYPGLRLISSLEVVTLSVISILATPILDIAFRFLLQKGKQGGIVIYDNLSSAFSIATRNLQRRRLRSLFTFVTLFIMTFSFIALTSLSVSYGLKQNSLLMKHSTTDGIMMRMHEYQYSSSTPLTWEIGQFYPVQEHTLEWMLSHEEVVNLAPKAEHQPNERETILGLVPELDPLMPAIDAAVIIGETLKEQGTCLLHESRIGRTEKGDFINIPVSEYVNFTLPVFDIGEYYDGLKIVGAVNDDILSITEMDGESMLPRVLKMAVSSDSAIRYNALPCEPEYVIITTLKDAIDRGCQISRVNILIDSEREINLIAQSLALGSGYRYWVSQEGKIDYIALGDILESKGFSLTVPYVIVILTVITTMMGSWYERRKEIDILSSIGLNPGHIAGIFLSESILLGLAAGTLGYLIALGTYPLMANLSFAPAIHQKTSANWILGAISISLSSALIGTLIALRQSISLTPSLKTRWNVREGITEDLDTYMIKMPVALTEAQVKDFVDYVETSLKSLMQTEEEISRAKLKGVLNLDLRQDETKSGRTYRISFMHLIDDYWNVTSNAIIVSWNKESKTYDVNMSTRGMEDGAANVGRMIRHIIMQWSTYLPEEDM